MAKIHPNKELLDTHYILLIKKVRHSDTSLTMLVMSDSITVIDNLILNSEIGLAGDID